MVMCVIFLDILLWLNGYLLMFLFTEVKHRAAQHLQMI